MLKGVLKKDLSNSRIFIPWYFTLMLVNQDNDMTYGEIERIITDANVCKEL